MERRSTFAAISADRSFCPRPPTRSRRVNPDAAVGNTRTVIETIEPPGFCSASWSSTTSQHSWADSTFTGKIRGRPWVKADGAIHMLKSPAHSLSRQASNLTLSGRSSFACATTGAAVSERRCGIGTDMQRNLDAASLDSTRVRKTWQHNRTVAMNGMETSRSAGQANPLARKDIPFDDINGQPPHREREGGPMPLDGLRHRNRDNGNCRKDQS
jgi:hypothetical protein